MPVYSVYLSNAGAPAPGLTPVWNALVRESDAAAQSQPSITAVAGGFYKFTATIPASEVWLGIIDGTATLPAADRYVPIRLAAEDVFVDAAVSAVPGSTWDVLQAGTPVADSMKTLVRDIIAPDGNSAAINAAAVNARLPAIPADDATVAKEVTLTTKSSQVSVDAVQSTVDALDLELDGVATQTSVDGIQTDVTAIKARTPRSRTI